MRRGHPAGWTVVTGDPRSRVVLHLPHGSTRVPDDVRPQLLLSDGELAAELQAMTDSGTRELAEAAAARAACRPWTFRNELSRLVVDPERFPDDREVMHRVGMGAVYTRTSDLRVLRHPDPERDARLLDRWFHPYADALADLVDERLSEHGSVVLLDLHSYPRLALPYEIHQDEARPQLCLGTDEEHTPSWLVDAAREAFRHCEVVFDQPFHGTYVPLRHYGVEQSVSSLMLEVRRDLPPGGDVMTAGLTVLLDLLQQT